MVNFMEQIPIVKVEYKILENNETDAMVNMTLNFAASIRLKENVTPELMTKLNELFQTAFEDRILDLASIVLIKWGQGLMPIQARLPSPVPFDVDNPS